MGDFNAGEMAHNIVDIYLKDQLEGAPDKEPTISETDPKKIVIDESILRKYLGDFELQPDFIISISQNKTQLFGQATGPPKLELIPNSETEFRVEGADVLIEFVPNEDQIFGMLKLHQGGQIMEALRKESFDKTSIDLSEFIGNYYSEELSTSYSFNLLEEQFVAQHSRLSDIALNPVRSDVFSGNAWFFAQIEFTRDTSWVVNGCKVSSGRVRNCLFGRWIRKQKSLLISFLFNLEL